MEENNFYLMGCDNFVVESDCSALGGLKDKPLADIKNERIQAIFTRINRYNFKVNHVPGSKNKVADLLSRQRSPSHQAADVDCPSRMVT